MTLRGNPIEETVALPDGRELRLRVAVPEDSYISGRELDTVDVELLDGDRHLAVVNTVLSADQDGEARQLAAEIVEGLQSGRLEPTAGALEPLADRLR